MTQLPNDPRWPLPPAGGQPPPLPPRPSWIVPVAVGALATAALHGFAVQDNILWLCFSCGCTGMPVGLLPALLAVRRDPLMGAGSGFALAFIATGLGAILVAGMTVWRGFDISDDELEALRQSWANLKMTPPEIQRNIDFLHHYGGTIAVFVAGLIALNGGISGAVVAALGGRRHRRRMYDPYRPSPPSPPPPPS
ncbi:MAG TPA: hypothetical protein VK348_09825 [Planctomycetota bacterium]|nr:hypothetical protein [Planctomycetota bacterium]